MHVNRLIAAGAATVALALPTVFTPSAWAGNTLTAEPAPTSAQPIDSIPPIVTGSAFADGLLHSWSKVLPFLQSGNPGCALISLTGSAYTCGA
ncbi:hypothetical protein [Nocardia mexicana]|uniref:Uncharacterized protein n=1 Tax=Nocardia mexicana TaxID=279262 RepID=A0A370HEI3_9NOCA|nr:hypothetical protein [Nocardia mexicana]RDI53293.1 hypothetical protein DFR68_103681 [Nocardia mexicana]